MMEFSNSNNEHSFSSDWPMENISTPGENDVVLGRGGASIHNPANIRYRNTVRSHQHEYVGYDDSRHMKTLLSHQLVNEWRQQSPPGRFLKKDETTGLWADVGVKGARKKTAQLLREGAKEIRQELRMTSGRNSSDKSDVSVTDESPRPTKIARRMSSSARSAR